MEILGVDIGGSGVKGAPVNIETGELTAERYRIPTPAPATPKAVAKTVVKLVKHFDWTGAVGYGFPAAIQNGVVKTASNIHKSWIGTNVVELFSQATGLRTRVLNDADAAGLAEMKFGAGKDQNGTVLIITVGTGLGSAMFSESRLFPNTELGHLFLKGKIAEHFASDAVRKNKDLNWKKWAKRFDQYLNRLQELFWLDLVIIGGGASKKFDKFSNFLTVKTKVVPAQLLNEAGIIGAALAAESTIGYLGK